MGGATEPVASSRRGKHCSLAVSAGTDQELDLSDGKGRGCRRSKSARYL